MTLREQKMVGTFDLASEAPASATRMIWSPVRLSAVCVSFTKINAPLYVKKRSILSR